VDKRGSIHYSFRNDNLRRTALKTWTQAEFNNVAAALEPLVGLRLQEVLTSEQDVVLGFYSSDGLLWLWIDLNAVSPSALPWTDLPLRPPAVKSPLALFLRAHFVNRVLRAIEVSPAHGRVAYLHFGKDGDELKLELRLFPHGRNLLAFAGGKRIAWQKPAPLHEAPEHGGVNPRALDELREQWLARKTLKKSGAQKPTDVKSRLENDLAKKRKALQKVEEELKRKQDLPWKTVGDWLKTHQELNVPKEYEPFVDKRRKLSWNIEHCFTKARESEGKIFGTEKRRETLRREIEDTEKKLAGPLREMPNLAAKPKVSLGDIEAQGRTLRISDELTAVAGKSAADNLKILRKARAWDLWFHMRDFPSSHAVLFRGKNTKVNDKTLFTVADWFVRNHLGAKSAQHAGEKFSLVIVECRHVRPIKGDKIGRVTYHDERVLIYQLPT
jgi:predicted ribosome quality control (RQC) complex YloA/Tae2 family protein